MGTTSTTGETWDAQWQLTAADLNDSFELGPVGFVTEDCNAGEFRKLVAESKDGWFQAYDNLYVPNPTQEWMDRVNVEVHGANKRITRSEPYA